MSLEFEYLHQKSNDIITLGTCFCFILIGRNLTAQLTRSHRGIGGGIQIPETLLQALLPFPALLSEHPGELAHRFNPSFNKTLEIRIAGSPCHL